MPDEGYDAADVGMAIDVLGGSVAGQILAVPLHPAPDSPGGSFHYAGMLSDMAAGFNTRRGCRLAGGLIDNRACALYNAG